jgi:epoxyqueuosine reductase QueG
MIVELQRRMREEGIDIFGTADLNGMLPEKLSATPYSVTLGVRLSDVVLDEVTCGPTHQYFHHYRTVNAFLDMCALKCIAYLQREGYKARAIPASQSTSESGYEGDFPHKTAANMAGLGFIGKSALFVSKDFGPRVRLATVLTDMPLKSGEMMPPQCADCRICADACPCGAITGEIWSKEKPREALVDAALCSHWMKAKYGHIGRGAVCGICAAVCPFGRRP